MKLSVFLSIVVSILLAAGDSAAGPADLVVAGEIEGASGLRFPDGTLQTSATRHRKYAKTWVVAKSGGDFESIQTAIDSITAWPSAPVLVWVAPGVYNETVVLKAGVHLQGAGRETTEIVFDATADTTVVELSDYSMISSLTIRCRSAVATADCTGIGKTAYSGASVRDVSIEAAAMSSGNATGIRMGTSSGYLTASDVFVWAHGGAVNHGIQHDGAFIELRNSEIRASSPVSGNYSNIALSGSAFINVYNSRLRAAGGISCRGLSWAGGSVKLWHTTVESNSTVSGSTCSGVYVQGNASLNLNWVTVQVDGATNQRGVHSAFSTTNILIRGIHSSIKAEDYTVFNTADSAWMEFEFSHFDGGIVFAGNGTVTCRYATDESFNAFANRCP